jgi:hypothetical protein
MVPINNTWQKKRPKAARSLCIQRLRMATRNWLNDCGSMAVMNEFFPAKGSFPLLRTEKSISELMKLVNE